MFERAIGTRLIILPVHRAAIRWPIGIAPWRLRKRRLDYWSGGGGWNRTSRLGANGHGFRLCPVRDWLCLPATLRFLNRKLMSARRTLYRSIHASLQHPPSVRQPVLFRDSIPAPFPRFDVPFRHKSIL